MLNVKTVMVTTPISVSKETPIREAMQILMDNGITGLPVVDADGHLLGIVSEKDMLALLYENRPSGGTVEDFMTRDVVSFNEDDDLVDLCEALIKGNFRRVPVLSEGKLVGIVSRTDLIRHILKMRKNL